jgi:antirestriction protein ArdC
MEAVMRSPADHPVSSKPTHPVPDFADLLQRAITEPGVISKAYTAFHGYSIGNQLLALIQCVERGLTPGPISTFMGWKDRGRWVRRGERAIVLCMPITYKRRDCAERPDNATEDGPESFTRFVFRPKWFVITQTDGQPVEETMIPQWDRERALATLNIVEEPFTSTDGNTQGYARQRSIAVSPIAELPYKTRFHELAHVVLGHTAEADAGLTDSELTPRSLREVEAEAVALVCLEALGLPGAEHSRGYIQAWNERRGAEPIPERSAQRIFKAADHILRAGVIQAAEEPTTFDAAGAFVDDSSNGGAQ